jgi:hypothetical protein
LWRKEKQIQNVYDDCCYGKADAISERKYRKDRRQDSHPDTENWNENCNDASDERCDTQSFLHLRDPLKGVDVSLSSS